MIIRNPLNCYPVKRLSQAGQKETRISIEVCANCVQDEFTLGTIRPGPNRGHAFHKRCHSTLSGRLRMAIICCFTPTGSVSLGAAH